MIILAKQPSGTLPIALVQSNTANSQSGHGNASTSAPPQARDHPDCDFYHNSRWADSLVVVMVYFAVGLTMEVLVLSGSANMKLVQLLIPTYTLWITYLPVYITLVIWMFIMVSMLLEDISHSQGNALRFFNASRFSKAATGEDLKSLLKVLDVVYFCTTLVGGFTLLFNDIVPLSLLMSGPTFYCMLLAMFKL